MGHTGSTKLTHHRCWFSTTASGTSPPLHGITTLFLHPFEPYSFRTTFLSGILIYWVQLHGATHEEVPPFVILWFIALMCQVSRYLPGLLKATNSHTFLSSILANINSPLTTGLWNGWSGVIFLYSFLLLFHPFEFLTEVLRALFCFGLYLT